MKLPLWRRKQQSELDAEIEAHLDAAVRERMERGESRAQAEAAVRREFGNVALVKDVTRDAWGWAALDRLLQDVRYGLRMLRRNPGFTLAAILTLGLGISVNAAIFSVVNAMLLRPLSAANPEQLVRIYAVSPEGRLQRNNSYLNYADYRDTRNVFDGLLACNLTPVSMRSGEGSIQRIAEIVSGNYFDVLGIAAAQGRTLRAEDDRAGAPRVAVVGHHFWQHHFAADPQLVGKTLALNGEAFTIIGIAAKDFPGTFEGVFIDLWVPLHQAAAWIGPDVLTNRDAPALRLLGRLGESVSITQAQAAMDTIAARQQQAYPDTNRGEGVRLERARFLDGPLRATVTAFLAIIMGFVGLVLVTACANFANLLLARAAGRRREMAVRRALGASRGRLIRQHLTEGVLLAALAGTVGLVLGVWMTSLLAQFNPLPASIPIRFDFSPDARVFSFVALVSALAGVLLGFAPGLHASRPDLVATLKDESAGSSGSRKSSRVRSALVIAQVALSAVLLIVATLFLRSLQHAQRLDLGFAPQSAVALDIDLKSDFTEEAATQYYRRLIERVGVLPGVQSVSTVNLLPLDIATPRVAVTIDGHVPPPGQSSLKISFNRVGLRYFETLRIPLLAGRDFNEHDDVTRPGVAIINETMARRFWPADDPIGKRIRLAAESENRQLAGRNMSGADLEVIGIAKNAKYRTLGEEPEPHMYVPYLQRFESGRTLVVRGAGNSARLIPLAKREVEVLHKDARAFFVRTVAEHMAFSLLPSRLAATLSGMFGLLALLLATIGVYGVVAYTVAQRTREIGVLMALGAQRSDVLRLILRQGLKLVIAGVIAGVALALAASRLIAGMLHGVSASDPPSFATVVLLLFTVALLACLIPARRASRVDPMAALRYQ